MSLAGKGRNNLPLTHTQTLARCDKFPSVTHKAVLDAIVRGSADQTLRGALLQIQASTRAALLCSASPGGQQAGYCHKGNHAVIHVSVPLHDIRSGKSGISPLVSGAVALIAPSDFQ